MTDENTLTVPSLPDGYMEYVGRVAMAWATFQWLVDDAIAVLAGIDSTRGAAFMTNISSMPGKFATLNTFLALRKCPEALQKELNKLITLSTTIGAQRNTIVHGVLLVSYATKSIIRRESKFKVGELKTSQTDVRELAEVLSQIGKLTEDFLSLFQRINASLSPLPLR